MNRDREWGGQHLMFFWCFLLGGAPPPSDVDLVMSVC